MKLLYVTLISAVLVSGCKKHIPLFQTPDSFLPFKNPLNYPAFILDDSIYIINNDPNGNGITLMEMSATKDTIISSDTLHLFNLKPNSFIDAQDTFGTAINMIRAKAGNYPNTRFYPLTITDNVDTLCYYIYDHKNSDGLEVMLPVYLRK